MIEAILTHMTAAGDLDDPLLRFSTQLEGNALDGTTETVSLASLFSCQGAVIDALKTVRESTGCLLQRQTNAALLAGVARAAGWLPLLPAEPLRTGILLLQAERAETRKASPQQVRSAFCDRGVALTAYDEGVIRLSMPATCWQPGEICHLQDILRSVA